MLTNLLITISLCTLYLKGVPLWPSQLSQITLNQIESKQLINNCNRPNLDVRLSVLRPPSGPWSLLKLTAVMRILEQTLSKALMPSLTAFTSQRCGKIWDWCSWLALLALLCVFFFFFFSQLSILITSLQYLYLSLFVFSPSIYSWCLSYYLVPSPSPTGSLLGGPS